MSFETVLILLGIIAAIAWGISRVNARDVYIVQEREPDPPVLHRATLRAHPRWAHPRPGDSPDLPDERRHFHLQVHGVYYPNQDGSSRQRAIQNCTPGEALQIVPEPDNPVSPDAMKVCRLNGEQLGYVDSANAVRLKHDVSIGWTFRVTVDEVFPADRPGYFGCRMRVGVLTMSTRTEATLAKKKLQMAALAVTPEIKTGA